MNRDLFKAAANRVRAEQFLQEKAASARGVDAVTLANFARTGQRMETEWAKVAAEKGGFFGHTLPVIGLSALPAVAGSLGALAALGQLSKPARVVAAVGGAVAAAGAVGSGVALMRKTAEPPPPKGMSLKEWDKILSKGPSKG